jgi:hypothetical protein
MDRPTDNAGEAWGIGASVARPPYNLGHAVQVMNRAIGRIEYNQLVAEFLGRQSLGLGNRVHE